MIALILLLLVIVLLLDVFGSYTSLNSQALVRALLLVLLVVVLLRLLGLV